MTQGLNSYHIKRIAGRKAFSLLKFVFICCVCYLFLFPLLYLVVSAIQDPTAAKDQNSVWIPQVLTLSNFKNAIELMNYGKSFGLSMIISILGTLATLISCSMAGYGLARFDFAEKKIAFTLVLILIVVPPQTTAMSVFLNYRFFNPLGLVSLFAPITGNENINMIGSPATMILPAIFADGIRSGLSIFIFRQFFLGQPKELEEAAMIDGCSIFSTYRKIMLPLSSPAIITVSVFSFVWYWNDSFYSTMFFTKENSPVAAQISFLRNTFLETATSGDYTVQEQKAILAAAALLCVIPPLILYCIIQRKFSESIERTGIVG